MLSAFSGKLKIVLVSLVLAAAGCTSGQIITHSMEFNRGMENATNQMLFLNAVRASHRSPMYFTDVTQVTAQPKMSGTLGFGIPFGPDAVTAFSASPSTTLSKQDSIVLVPLNKKEFYRGILSPVNFDIVGSYVGQGWPLDTLMYLFIEDVRISTKRAHFLLERAGYACELRDAKSEQRQNACKYFRASLCALMTSGTDLCSNVTDAELVRFAKRAINLTDARVENDPEDDTEFAKFNVMVLALWVLDFDIAPAKGGREFSATKKTSKYEPAMREHSGAKVPVRDDNGNVTLVEYSIEEKPGAAKQLILLTDIPSNYPADLGRIRTEYCKTDAQNVPLDVCAVTLVTSSNHLSDAEIGGTLRSPQGMLFYLGELINAQRKLNRSGQIAKEIFPVVFGRAKNAVVTIRYRGEYYSIESGDRGSQSMQSIALVNQILNLKKNSNELPTVPTVISTGG